MFELESPLLFRFFKKTYQKGLIESKNFSQLKPTLYNPTRFLKVKKIKKKTTQMHKKWLLLFFYGIIYSRNRFSAEKKELPRGTKNLIDIRIVVTKNLTSIF